MGVPPPPTETRAEAPSRHAELGEFLRLHREATTPASVGLEVVGRRRTPGLRREEVSQLAGVGLSWYTWLEQGRDVTPSAGVLDALARVLDLRVAERAHLFHLSGVAVPTADGAYPTEAPVHLAAIVEGLEPYPAYLLGPRMDVLAWNAAATRLLGTPTAAPDGTTNLLWWMFTADGADDRGPQWHATARSNVARFRAQHARRYDDPRFRELLDALLDVSPAFRELWPRHEVLADQVGTKVIERDDLGRLEIYHLQSVPTSDPDLRLTQFVPADDATRATFARLSAEAASAQAPAGR
ncbi:helix-turn-helix transcriptional regulator [Patulibacter minatonensis]|uniref:helix-turn-helix transcriptional regulator n=1 Tax=Patulibacter minatonensis TaxID=298163 RepID=UPI00146FA3F3|nr:helix-turn-helix transcriptional regulator [Patulibacter minatonensis]